MCVMGSPCPSERDRRLDTITQDALELGGIVRVCQFAWAWQIEIVQTRYPEAQRRGAQQPGPAHAFFITQRPQFVIGAHQTLDARVIEYRLSEIRAAPIVDGDRKIVSKKIGCRESEVDDAGNASVVEQHVVTEQ